LRASAAVHVRQREIQRGRGAELLGLLEDRGQLAAGVLVHPGHPGWVAEEHQLGARNEVEVHVVVAERVVRAAVMQIEPVDAGYADGDGV
jgi:hypothetical protein